MLYIFLIIILVIGLILLFWIRFISTKGLINRKYEIKSLKLKDYDNFNILHFTDLHYGSTIHLKELKKLVNTINAQNPDVVVFTGDLVENKVKLNKQEVKDLTKELNRIRPKYEVIAVPGNHDYDHEYFHEITPNLNWHILINKNELFYFNNSKEPIAFVGLDDLLDGKPNYKKAFNLDKDIYTIVLAHEPDQIDEFIDYKFNLVLCGHSHLGQVRLPFIGALYTPIGCKKYYDEHYKINKADLYISGGLGTSVWKLRYFNKPSINIYHFKTR